MLRASHLNIFEVPCWLLSKILSKENISNGGHMIIEFSSLQELLGLL